MRLPPGLCPVTPFGGVKQPPNPSWRRLGHTCATPPPFSHSWIRHCNVQLPEHTQEAPFGSACRTHLKPGVHTNDFAPDSPSARLKTRSRVTRDCISPRSAHISADSPGESGVAALKVSANHNRCHYWSVSKHQMAPWCIYTPAALRESLGVDRVVV